jgi:hypothetical protein
MLVSHKHKFVYYAPQKTGTRSLCRLLTRELQSDVISQRAMVDRGFSRHSITHSQRGKTPEEEDCQDYYHFITVRDPHTRAVSHWKYLHRKRQFKTDAFRALYARAMQMRFPEFILSLTDEDLALLNSRKEFLSDGLMWSQSRWLSAMPKVDAIVRLESFEKDIRGLPFVPDDVEVPHINVAGLPNYKPYGGEIGAQAKQRVLDWYGEDFERLGYPHELV